MVVEYDGTAFYGFQLQGQGERTVQGVLQRTITKLSGQETTVHGAGRTDTGVHARGQVVHFDTTWKVPIHKAGIALNGSLPNDVAVRECKEVDKEFHSRFSAKQRTYVYLIWTLEQRSALWGRYSMHEPRPLDVAAMSEVAFALQGRRDFASFANKSEVEPPHMVRDLRRFDVRSAGRGRFIAVRLTADGFLRSMVRNLVGGLRMVGLGEIQPGQLYEIAEKADRTMNRCPTAAANGLCLWRVDY